MANGMIAMQESDLLALQLERDDALRNAERHRQAWLEMSEQYHTLKSQADSLVRSLERSVGRALAWSADVDVLKTYVLEQLNRYRKAAAEGEVSGAVSALQVARSHFEEMEDKGEINKPTFYLLLDALKDIEKACETMAWWPR